MEIENLRGVVFGEYLKPERIKDFYINVELDTLSGCWRWHGLTINGAPVYCHSGITETAARVAWKDAGRILDKKDMIRRMKHVCKHRDCINPGHRRRYPGSNTLGKNKAKNTSPIPSTPAADVTQPFVPIVRARMPYTNQPTEPEPIDFAVTDAEIIDLISQTITTVVNVPHACIIYTPDPNCCGYGSDFRSAAANAIAKIKASRNKGGSYATKKAQPSIDGCRTNATDKDLSHSSSSESNSSDSECLFTSDSTISQS